MADSIVLNAGELRWVIQIQMLTGTADAFNQVDKSNDANWTTILTCWAKAEHLTGGETFASPRVLAQSTEKFTTRWQLGTYQNQSIRISILHRAVFNGRRFDINDVNNVEERNAVMVLLCKESDAQSPIQS